MNARSSLPSSVLDTSGLPTKAAISAWQESIGVMFDVRPRQTAEDAFHARVEAYMVGELALGACSSGAQSFDRSRRRIERDDLDHIVLQFYMRGTCGHRDGSADEKTSPGDLWISDLAMPLATGVTDFDNLNLVVPRRLLAPQLKMPEGHHMSILPGSSPLVGLLRNHLEALFRSAPHMSRQDADAVVRPTIELAAATLNGKPSEENAQGVASSLFGAILRHVDAHLSAPDMSAETVAAAFGISPRKLYYLFEPRGGFASYVQDQRLQRCHEALSDPAQRHRSVAEIAASYGFTHPKSFSRAFSRKIGMTAREVRSLAADRDHSALGRSASDQWWSWIERMR